MRLHMYTDCLLNDLKQNYVNNIEKYKNNTKFVNQVTNDYDAQLYDLNKDVIFPKLDDSIASNNGLQQWEIDFANSIKLHKEFVLKYNIPLSILLDERFIAYLAHDVYYDYMVKRWPVEEAKNPESRILNRYFLPSSNLAFTRNLFAKFFWYTNITFNQIDDFDPYRLTKIAFEYADPVNQIMERKYGRNEKIVKCALQAIENVGNKTLNKKRTIYGKTINNILSLQALDVYKKDDLIALFESEIKEIVCDDLEDESPVEEE